MMQTGDITEMKADLDIFQQKIKIFRILHKETENTEQESTLEPIQSLVKKKGTFHPPLGRDKDLDDFIKQVQIFPLNNY